MAEEDDTLLAARLQDEIEPTTDDVGAVPLVKVVPENNGPTNGYGSVEQPSLGVADSNDPPEGRSLMFKDRVRRIDFILAWNGKESEIDKAKHAPLRDTFCKNLILEGLNLEEDVEEGRDVQYMKLHATWEVLTRYAEVMKVRMPMKEVPEEVGSASLWEYMSDAMRTFLRPFQLDEREVPPLPKKFTCPFQRNKEYLFAIPEHRELFFSHATRSRIVDYILRRKKYADAANEPFAFGITRLIAQSVYSAAYPLHEGSWKPWAKASMRRLLYVHWAHWKNFYKCQPLDYIRNYFGEKIGLYFAWLGFYTWMLFPASVAGIVVFIFGCATMDDNVIMQETCNDSTTIMCPQCDMRCPYWRLSEGCLHSKVSRMFDNGGTVFLALFMSLWGTIFLEFWKREQAAIQFKWNLITFEEEEQPPRPEYLMKLANSKYRKKHQVTGEDEPFHPFWRRKVPVMLASFSCMLFLVFIALAVVVGVVLYRMAVITALYLSDDEVYYKNASLVTTVTAACINLIIIFILNWVYDIIATKLTDWENLRTQSEYDDSLTIKLYVLQFVNYYSSIFYIAFFKGRFRGRPGDYLTLVGARQEECQVGGCLIELAIQLAIIFVGKQLIQNNLMEIVLPRIMRRIRICMSHDSESIKKKNRAPWEKDYILTQMGSRGLFNEWLEMLLQFGFVTIFVAAFPLAPMFALLNNVIEVRADADKFITQLQRPMATQAQEIGIWYEILNGVATLAVMTNAIIIAFTSSYIHRFVYMYSYSPDGSLSGFVDFQLATFKVSDLENGTEYRDLEKEWTNLTECRYLDYREPPSSPEKYAYTRTYWHIMAAQFIFIVLFENLVLLVTSMIAYAIPDMPRKMREQVRREAYLTNEIIIKTELERTLGEDMLIGDGEMDGMRWRARAPYSHGLLDSSAHPSDVDTHV